MYRQTQQCGKGRGMVGGGALAFLVAGLLAGQACPTSQPPRAEDVARSAAGDPEGKQEARVDFHGDPLPAGAVARFGTVRMRHHDGITGVALSPDGKILATVGEHRDHEHLALACLGLACPIRLWDTATGKELGQLSGHSCLPRGLAFSPDGKILASLVAWPIPAGEDSVRLWDVVSRKPLHRLQGSQLPQPEESGCNYRYGLVFSPDGKLLAAVGRDGHLRLWDVASGKLVRKWFDEAWGTCLAFSPDGRLLAEADTKGVLVWDVASGRQVQKFTGHAAPVASLFFSPKGDQVIAGDEKDVIRWWDRGTGKAVRESRGVLLGASADGNVVAIHRGKGRISLCDIVQAKEVRHFPFPGKYLGCAGYCPYPPAALSANGEVLVTTEGSTALLLNTRSGRWADFSRGHTDKVVFVGFSADGKQVISAGDTAVLVWDAQSGQYLHQLRNEWELIGAACMTADRRLLATGVADGSVRLWDLASGRQVRRMPIPGTFWPLPVFSPDGKQLAVNVRYAGRDTAIRLFQTNTGKDLSGFSADNNQGGLAFLPNGKALVGLDYSLRIFDAAEGTILLDCKEMCTQGIQTGLAVSSDGRFAATGCPKDRPPSGNIPSGIALWEFLTGTRIARLEGHEGPVTALALSQDGRWLATGGWEGTVRLWEVPSGKEVASRRGHRGRVLALAWSADDNFLASGSADTSVLLWDMSALRKAPGVQERRLREDEANKLWTLLSSQEAGPASKALWQFVASPADAVPFLRQRLERPEATEQEIKLLVAALDDAKFEARVRATSELEAVGGKAEKALQSALRAKPTPESRRRLDELLAKLRAPAPRYSGQQLREIRAVQILEYIASPTACAVLRGVVQRRRGTFLATEASTALERAEKRGKGLPAGGKH